MDVKYHRMSTQSNDNIESAQETLHWLALLRCCSAKESFLKQSNGNIKRQEVAKFLIFNENFPRTIFYCINKAKNTLFKLYPDENRIINQRSYFLLFQLLKTLKQLSQEELIETEIHNELTHIVNTTATICDAVYDEFFNTELQNIHVQSEIKLA